MPWFAGLMKWLDVVVGVVLENNCVLIAQRALNATHGGMWEFPGGKIESGESSEEALKRELKEEVSITVTKTAFIQKIDHSYGNWGVSLFVYEVLQFEGKAEALESQLQLKWVSIDQLRHFPFPKANQAIIAYLGAVLSDALQPATVLE